MLIIFEVDTFVEKNEKFNAVIIVHEYINDFVTFDFHVQLVQNLDQIVSVHKNFVEFEKPRSKRE